MFNRYNYTLDFPVNHDISIITGPNGYGKTTILRIIDYIYSGNIYPFFGLSFRKIRLTFSNSDKEYAELSIEKKTKEKDTDSQSDIISDNKTFLEISLKDQSDITTITLSLTAIESAIVAAGFYKGGADIWWKHNSNEYYTSSEILRIHKEVIQKQFTGATEILMFLGGLNATLVSDQRLSYQEFDRNLSAKSSVHMNKLQVLKDAQWLKENLTNLKNQFSEKLTAAMMNAISSSASDFYNPDEISERIIALNKKTDTLVQFGISDEHQRIPATLNNGSTGIITNMVKNYEKVVNETFAEIENHILFYDLIQKSDFPEKSIRLDPANGVSFVSDDGTYIAPEWLSSGEQHKLILWFQLLFRAKNGMLLLIDEPELSFHVVWQSSFIKEMEQIIRKREIQVIAATHSPQIIDGKWSITTDLYDLSMKK